MGEIGLFPLGIVLLPGERAPLHIFEERYRELIGECLETEGEFGILLAEESSIRAVGTTAAVTEVLERYPDGSLNIIVTGRRRFRVDRMTEGRSYLTAEIEDLDDEDDDDDVVGTDPEEAERDRSDVAACLDAYRRLVEAADTDPGAPDLSAQSLAFEIAGRVDFGTEVKQELLETLSERHRLRRLTELLETAVEALERRQAIRDRVSGNGHVPDE